MKFQVGTTGTVDNQWFEVNEIDYEGNIWANDREGESFQLDPERVEHIDE